MVACFRLGAVVLPCNEQLRAGDLRVRLDAARPALVLADERNLSELAAARPECEVLAVPDDALLAAEPAPAAELAPERPVPDRVHERHRGRAQGRRARPALPSRPTHCRPSTGSRPAAGELVWCTAASGLVQIGAQRLHRAVAAGRGGAAARRSLRARGAPRDPRARARERALHGADRVPRDRQARAPAAVAGTAPDWWRPARRSTPRSCARGRRPIGLGIRDGYGQTETGQLTANPPGRAAAAGIDGPAAARAWPCAWTTVSWCWPNPPPTRPSSSATSTGPRRRRAPGAPATACGPTTDGYLYFEGRTDDVIISAGYRIGPFEVESSLVAHPAVAEAAVVAAPDEERGSVVRAVVVLRDGFVAADELAVELAGPRQAPDGAVQVPAGGRVRRRAAEDRERQGAPRAAARARLEPAAARARRPAPATVRRRSP